MLLPIKPKRFASFFLLLSIFSKFDVLSADTCGFWALK